MLKLIILMSLQSLFLVLSQILLKKGMSIININTISFSLIYDILKNFWIYMAILSIIISGIIWIYVLKRYDFSIAYPLVSISYIYSTIISKYYLNEKINLMMILGIGIIILGIIFLSIGKKSLI